MPPHPNTLNHPRFPPMDWDDCESWTGDISLSFGNDADLNVTPYDSNISRMPTPAQGDALAFHIQNGDRVFTAVLEMLLPYYQRMRPKYVDYLGDDADQLMPEVTQHEALTPLIDLQQVHIHPWEKLGVGYVGLQFGCTWDIEHGLGVMMHNDRVVELGGADVAFAWEPQDADDN
ncbi:MAG: DUF6985 domain-containing protein [Candidatus Promineifilaceae bacterium]